MGENERFFKRFEGLPPPGDATDEDILGGWGSGGCAKFGDDGHERQSASERRFATVRKSRLISKF
jgi:hypothetical protein